MQICLSNPTIAYQKQKMAEKIEMVNMKCLNSKFTQLGQQNITEFNNIMFQNMHNVNRASMVNFN